MTDLPKWNEPPETLRAADMSVLGGLFAIRFVNDNQVELYVEDDENYFLKARFSRDWLEDLAETSSEADAIACINAAVGGAQRD